MAPSTLAPKLCLPSLCVRSWDMQVVTPWDDASEHIEDVYDFEDARELGAGGFGIVRKAVRKSTDEVHAIKTFMKVGFKSNDLVRHEIDMLGQLHHPCICPLIDTFEDQKHMHMVMEYIDGHELFKEIVEQNVLSEARSAGIIQQVFSALQHCHQKRIIHRDVKPENIMIYRTQVRGGMGNKQAPMVKLIDFGLAIWYDHESVTETADDCLMACHYYLAPEAMRGNAMPASDVFSAGVVLHLMLAGHMPHRDVISGRQVLEGSSWAAISSSAKDLVCQALRSHPAERITAEEAAEHKWSHNIEVNYQPQDNNKTHVKVCNSLVRHDDVKPSALIAEISLLLKGSTWAFGEKNTDLIIDIMSSSVESRTKSFFDSAWVATEAWSRRVQ